VAQTGGVLEQGVIDATDMAMYCAVAGAYASQFTSDDANPKGCMQHITTRLYPEVFRWYRRSW